MKNNPVTNSLINSFGKLTQHQSRAVAELPASTAEGISNHTAALVRGLATLDAEIARIFEVLPDGRRIFGPEYEALQKLASDNNVELQKILGGVRLSKTGFAVRAEFNGHGLSNIDALKDLTNLIVLGLSVNQIKDLTALQGLTNLTGLMLNNNQINDLTPLQGLTKLTILWLQNNPLTAASKKIPEHLKARGVNIRA